MLTVAPADPNAYINLSSTIRSSMLTSDIPPQLAERIEQYRAGIFRIDILRRYGKVWRKVGEVVADPRETDDTADLIERVFDCAGRHADHVGGGGRYRALIRRQFRHEREKRAATFDVETGYERRSRERDKRAAQRSRRPVRNVHDAQWKFLELAMDTHQRLLDQHQEMSRIRARTIARQRAQMVQCMALYEAGLQMQGETTRELADARIMQALEDERRRSSKGRWETIQPAVEVVLAHLGRRLSGDETGKDPATNGDPAANPD